MSRVSWLSFKSSVSYPKAPVPVVMINTRTDLVLSKLSRVLWRDPDGVLPSMRAKQILALFRCFPIKSRVRVQHEKIILNTLALAASWKTESPTFASCQYPSARLQ